MTEHNDRSNKVLSVVSIIDALNFDEDELSDLTSYLAKKCGFDLTTFVTPQKWTPSKPLNAYDLKVTGDYVATLKGGFNLDSDLMDYDRIDKARRADTSLLEGKTVQEINEQAHKELQAIEAMAISLPPVDAYNLVAIVQAAIVCLELPERSEEVGNRFVHAFCDRYRDQMPTIVQLINSGWDNSQLVTAEESEESLGEKWQRIARDVEQEMGGQVKISVDTIGDMYDGFFGLVEDIYQDIDLDDDDDLEDRCASGHTN